MVQAAILSIFFVGCSALFGFEDREFGDDPPKGESGDGGSIADGNGLPVRNGDATAGADGGIDAGLEIAAKGGALRFSELSGAGWFEVRNVSSAAVDLAKYRLLTYRATPPPADAGVVNTADYQLQPLPALVVAAGAYALVRQVLPGESAEVALGPEHVSLTGAALFPSRWQNLNVTLLDESGAASDTLRFGAPTGDPLAKEDWQGASLTVPGANDVLARSLQGRDSNQASDWKLVAFETPAAPNDVNDCDKDDDKDGIPDCAEATGRTFAGEDYFAFGARPAKFDIFVEMDQMSTTDPLNIIYREALDTSLRMFASKSMALHMDVGARYDAAPGINPAAYDLGGGNEVPFVQVSSFDLIHSLKPKHMRPRRWNAFHYFVVAADADTGAGGTAELFGNDGVVFFGFYKKGGFTTGDFAVGNDQAQDFSHELGHNLNLRHGGNDDINYKPNYISIMNYLWRAAAPIPGTERAWYDFSACKKTMPTSNNFALTPYNQFFMDFSNGSRAALNEAALTDGVLDYNCNGANETGYSADITREGKIEVLNDFNDWANIKAFVYSPGQKQGGIAGLAAPRRLGSGRTLAWEDTPISYVVSDRGVVVPEAPR
jgi:hypothetical protein